MEGDGHEASVGRDDVPAAAAATGGDVQGDGLGRRLLEETVEGYRLLEVEGEQPVAPLRDE